MFTEYVSEYFTLKINNKRSLRDTTCRTECFCSKGMRRIQRWGVRKGVIQWEKSLCPLRQIKIKPLLNQRIQMSVEGRTLVRPYLCKASFQI